MISAYGCDNQEEWDEYVIDHAGHPLQLWGWGEVKAAHGWRADRVFFAYGDRVVGAAQLLVRPLPWPFKALVYVPRGPIAELDDREEVLAGLAEYAKKTYKPVAVTIEPDWAEVPEYAKGWEQARNTILIPRTLILDLRKSEDELLAVMSKKTRQYIRKSEVDGVIVHRVKNLQQIDECLTIYKDTAKRAGFAIHGDDYYRDIFTKMGECSPVFVAEFKGDIVAFLWPIISGDTVFELYGGMSQTGQQVRANYVLKWKVIQTMKHWGLTRYDMNGLLNDGVSTFKQSFADHEDELAGTYDRPLSWLYVVWAKVLPFGKKIVRTIKR